MPEDDPLTDEEHDFRDMLSNPRRKREFAAWASRCRAEWLRRRPVPIEKPKAAKRAHRPQAEKTPMRWEALDDID